jgi:hypothetical protein
VIVAQLGASAGSRVAKAHGASSIRAVAMLYTEHFNLSAHELEHFPPENASRKGADKQKCFHGLSVPIRPV